MAQVLQKICTCIFCSEVACCAASCVDQWWGIEAQGLACLNFGSCCWKSCAPICFSCQLGDVKGGFGDCCKGFKYCLFSFAMCLAGPVDGIYACIKTIIKSCSGELKSFQAMKSDFGFIAQKFKSALSIQSGSEPMKTMGTYSP